MQRFHQEFVHMKDLSSSEVFSVSDWAEPAWGQCLGHPEGESLATRNQ